MKKGILWTATIILVLAALFNIALAATATPGSDSDPLITSSYLDKKMAEISGSIQTAVKNLEAKIEQMNSNLSVMDKKVEAISKQSGGVSGAIYEVVNLPAGKKLIGENSTEIILRSGKGKIFSSNTAGLSDVTTGYDVVPGALVERNHLLIVPRTDGRGVKAQTACVLMVKGAYTIE
ncbi:MAG: hypothetical protein ACM3UU_07375 [Ignavibacteriales bacterium]